MAMATSLSFGPFQVRRPAFKAALVFAFALALAGGPDDARADEDPLADLDRFMEVSPDLFRGAQPNPIHMAELKRRGIRTLMSFVKSPYEDVQQEAAEARRLGLRFFAFPITTMKGPNDEQINAIFTELLRPSNAPVFIHCRHGKDRTGLIAGLYRVHLQYWTADAAYREMRSMGFNPLFLGLTWDFWTYSQPGAIRAIEDEGSLAEATPAPVQF